MNFSAKRLIRNSAVHSRGWLRDAQGPRGRRRAFVGGAPVRRGPRSRSARGTRRARRPRPAAALSADASATARTLVYRAAFSRGQCVRPPQTPPPGRTEGQRTISSRFRRLEVGRAGFSRGLSPCFTGGHLPLVTSRVHYSVLISYLMTPVI